jgi:hypothetical protein
MSPRVAHLRWLVVLDLLACARVDTPVGAEVPSVPLYLEAEDGALSGGFSIQSDPRASGGLFIAPPDMPSVDSPGSAAAVYSFRTTSAHDTYVIWGRIHAPEPFPNNSFWVSVDGAPATQWRLSTGVIWFWGPVSRDTDYGVNILYPLDAGLHQLVIRNSGTDLGLDRLSIQLAPGHVPPGNDTHCSPPDSIETDDASCFNSCGSQRGTACGLQACNGFVPLPSYDCSVCCRVPDAAPIDADDLAQ